MVKAGAPTDAVIDELAGLLEPGDILIDGGNARFQDTRRREAALRKKGIHFVGCGISGGEEGALKGPSIMPGGSAEAYQKWNRGDLDSFLIEITAEVLRHVDADTGKPFVDVVVDAAGAAVAYYDGLRSARLPASIIRGQRDFFGAHGYQRVDRQGSYHTQWSGDRTEISVRWPGRPLSSILATDIGGCGRDLDENWEVSSSPAALHA